MNNINKEQSELIVKLENMDTIHQKKNYINQLLVKEKELEDKDVELEKKDTTISILRKELLQNGRSKNHASSLIFSSAIDSELLPIIPSVIDASNRSTNSNNDDDTFSVISTTIDLLLSPGVQSPISSSENVSNNPFNINLNEITNEITKSRIKKKRKIRNDENNKDNLDMTSKMGLPDGWTTTVEKHGAYKFTGPDGDPIIKSKRSLISYFGFNPELKVKTLPIAMTNDGDPKWRTSDNIYLGVRLIFSPNNGEVNFNECRGTVSAWISKNDKDKDGKPGFESVVTGDGKP